jgi:hypothetical protein
MAASGRDLVGRCGGTSVVDGSQDAFTAEEICEQAKGNVGALSLLLLAYARDRGHPLDEAARFGGRVFAPGWDELPARDARTAVRWAALNMVSGGSELRRLEGDARRATAVVGRWPTDEELAFFGLSQQEADLLYELFSPIAERLGLAFTWRRDGGDVTMIFTVADE